MFYNETIQNTVPGGVTKFPSDVTLSQDPRVRDEFLSFIDNQDHWNEVCRFGPRPLADSALT